MKENYLVFDVGCIECWEPSGIIGYAETEEQAETMANRALERQREDWQGQHSMQIFPLASRSRYAADE